MATKSWAIMLIITTTLLTSAAQILYKLGSQKLDFGNIFGVFTNYYLIGGGLLYCIGAVLMKFFQNFRRTRRSKHNHPAQRAKIKFVNFLNG